MTIQSHSNFLKPYTLNYPYTSIEKILHIHSSYPQYKKQLHHKQIIYLEQLTSYNNSILLEWQHISPRFQQIPTGRKPAWFKTIEEQLIDNQQNRYINATLAQLPQTNSLAFTTGHYNKKSKP